jgi:membrane protease YdiL (CAAX protease family)
VAIELRDPESGLSYPETLVTAAEPFAQRSVAGVLGTFLAVVTYLVVVPIVALAGNMAAWALAGSPGEFKDYAARAQAMEIPAGMFTRHLAVACLILIALAAVGWFHRVRVRWLFSVQPGFRWRFGFLCFAASLVILSLAGWAETGFATLAVTPQADFGWFLAMIILTTPLQAAAEEIFFRGYLLQSLTLVARNKWVGVALSAALFAFFHAGTDPLLFSYRFGFGLIAGAIVVLTGGLEAGIAAHVVNNLLSFTTAALTTSVATALVVTTITWNQLVFPLLGFAACGAVAVALGRKLRVATQTP